MCDGSAGTDTLIADLCVCGVWEPQTEALFDIRIFDTDAWSYHAHRPCDVLGSAKVEKCKYLQACQNRHATITALCVSVDGMLGSEAEFLSTNWVTFLLQYGKDPTAL